MKTFKKTLSKATSILESFSGILLICMLVISVTNILLRAIFNYPIFGTYEMVCYISLLMGASALASVELTDSNISVSIVPEALARKPKALKALKLVTDFFVMIGCSIAGYKLIGLAQNKFANGNVTGDLRMPIYIFVLIISVGFFLIVICELFKVLNAIFGKDDKPTITDGDQFDSSSNTL